MTYFFLFLMVIIIQRLTELIIAKKNEKWMKNNGAIEFNQEHYRIIVFIHSLFFIVFFLEVTIFDKVNSPYWIPLLSIFILTQFIRVWTIKSLGKYWNTKIIVLPEAQIVKKGPYRVMKHPNYLVVSLEFMIIPILFEAYITAIVFTILNGIILAVRIPAEEKALNEFTEYQLSFFTKPK